NSRLAQELGAWATTQADGEGIHDALFHAYFVAGKNIGNIDTLIEVAEAVGLSGAEARQALVARRFKDTVELGILYGLQYAAEDRSGRIAHSDQIRPRNQWLGFEALLPVLGEFSSCQLVILEHAIARHHVQTVKF